MMSDIYNAIDEEVVYKYK